MTTRYAWSPRGDINAFFGLILDNVAVMSLLLVLITSADAANTGHFSREFVFRQMIPGTALGVVVGDLVYTWLALRLARRTGRANVTAMPLGLDTPSTFAVGGLILLPALKFGMEHYGYDHRQAMFFAWHVGAVLLVIVGIAKSIVAPLGSAVRRWLPRAGLLGSLAGIALALIALVPLWQNIASLPLVGMVTLSFILVTLVAHHPLPGRLPGALVAVALGTILYWGLVKLGPLMNWTLVPPPAHTAIAAWRLPEFLPEFARNAGWWQRVFAHALTQLPIMLPFALATVVGGIDCTESAAAAGDEFDTRAILWTEGIASLLAGLAGGVIQTVPYIGQPAYKAMGGRAGYTLATAVFIGLAGGLGWFAQLFDWLPEAACFPILVFVGLEIGAQSFRATPARHYAAFMLAMLPALAYLALIPMNMVLAALPPDQQPMLTAPLLALRCLASGFIVTSLLWASSLSAILDRRMYRAALFLVVAAACSLIGVIHSPLSPESIAWPWDVLARMSHDPSILCQSPYHWAGGYLLAAGVLAVLGLLDTNDNRAEDLAHSRSDRIDKKALPAAGVSSILSGTEDLTNVSRIDGRNRGITLFLTVCYGLAVTAAGLFHNHRDSGDGCCRVSSTTSAGHSHGDRPGIAGFYRGLHCEDGSQCAICKFLAQKTLSTAAVEKVTLAALALPFALATPPQCISPVPASWHSRAPPDVA